MNKQYSQSGNEIAIPVYKRIMHDNKGKLTEQPYGNKDEAIYSVSRAQMNVLMMDLAEKMELSYILVKNVLMSILNNQ